MPLPGLPSSPPASPRPEKQRDRGSFKRVTTEFKNGIELSAAAFLSVGELLPLEPSTETASELTGEEGRLLLLCYVCSRLI